MAKRAGCSSTEETNEEVEEEDEAVERGSKI